MIGVGVGSGITQSSNWVSDPGAGYRTQWERGSYSYVRDTIGYEARYQKRNSKNGPYYWVNLVTYNAAANNRRNDAGWTSVTEAEYLTFENPVNTNSNDGGRTVIAGSTPVSTAEYQANSSNPLYRAVTKTYNNGPTGRSGRVRAAAATPTSIGRPRSTTARPTRRTTRRSRPSTRNDVILARMIAGNDNGTPAIWDGTKLHQRRDRRHVRAPAVVAVRQGDGGRRAR